MRRRWTGVDRRIRRALAHPLRSACISLGIALVGFVESILIAFVMLGIGLGQEWMHWFRYGDAAAYPLHSVLDTAIVSLVAHVLTVQVYILEDIGALGALTFLAVWTFRRIAAAFG